MKSINNKFLTVLLLLIPLIFSACASTLKISSMTPGNVTVAHQYEKNVTVLVQAGLEPPGMNNPREETNHKIATAVEQSIKNSHVFANVVQRKQADYLLNISMISLEYDGKPFGYTAANIEMAWALIDLDNRQVLFRKSISTSKTIKFSWHESVNSRRRKAMEGAIQSNIQQGLELLSELNVRKH